MEKSLLATASSQKGQSHINASSRAPAVRVGRWDDNPIITVIKKNFFIILFAANSENESSVFTNRAVTDSQIISIFSSQQLNISTKFYPVFLSYSGVQNTC